MKNKIINVLDVPFYNVTFNEMVNTLTNRIQSNQKTFVVTANPEIVMHAYENDDYMQMVRQADFVTPDGVGILIGAKILNNYIKERVTGFDMTMELLNRANEHQWKVYLLGGKEETNEKAVTNIKIQFPNLNLIGHHHGYFNWEDKQIQKEIQQLQPDIVLVALGFPRQEKWIYENLNEFTKGIFIGVGGSIDVLAGEVKRAPAFWQKLKLEWFYRLLKQPSRWRRMLVLPRFVIEVLKVKFLGHK
ncbi:WecB/TagA/CpsF family glycosyltransferase [Bacillus sp. 31A1R]|uniref:N-acetylglucosaminyldiphosphoundecaprenol N-acetyl-beta-D-mannosaminyltransferase n=1 Tax=Robertmurraya mangrovi TaxID=3098077 RepID=A0ABU5IXN1_9BACI|nr:WecB/TagA/CpsF family glycosyltransferase [Bacillus sp. 31A1R]MDZ5471929.1 WecB/TagA/CpsF family glycosyltransferase [Bacillus sp. 31A1R]